MTLDKAIADALRATSTATLTTVLLKKGIRRCWMQGPMPIFNATEQHRRARLHPALRARPRGPGDAGILVLAALHPRRHRGHAGRLHRRGRRHGRRPMRASSATSSRARMKKRGVAALVTDGVVRDAAGVEGTELPVWCAGVAAPPSVAGLTFVGWQEPIGCGGVAVFPDDVIVADGDGVVVIPAAMVEEVAKAAVEQEQLELWIMREVEKGVPLPGLYPPNAETKARYEAETAKS